MKKAVCARPNEKLANERIKRGLSQKEVAEKVGTTRINVSRWERGLTFPTLYFRQQLLSFFGLNVEELGLATKQWNMQKSQHDIVQKDQNVPQNQAYGSTTEILKLPYPYNHLFTGRQVLLEEIYNKFNVKNGYRQCVIRGLGGIGKTQIALEYAHRYKDMYQAIFWYSFDASQKSIQGQIAKGNGQGTKINLNEIIQKMSETSAWLLILDDVEDTQSIRELLVSDQNGHILITTRGQILGAAITTIDIPPMEREEGALFLLLRANIINPHYSIESIPEDLWNLALTVVSLVDGHALALDQGGAYIEEKGCSLAKYLALYRYKSTTLLSLRGSVSIYHPESVMTTFTASIRQVGEIHPWVINYLRFCTFFFPTPTPEELLVESSIVSEEQLHLSQHSEASSPLFDDIIVALRKQSLINYDPRECTLSIHQLVQVVVNNSMDEDIRKTFLEEVIIAVHRVFPTEPLHELQRCKRYLSHIRICANLIEQEVILLPEAGQLLYRLGTYLFECEHFHEAEAMYQRALKLFMKISGSDHPDTLRCHVALARVFLARGDYERVASFCQYIVNNGRKEYTYDKKLAEYIVDTLMLFHMKTIE